jgi:pyrrolidone-carboxylate peptidase
MDKYQLLTGRATSRREVVTSTSELIKRLRIGNNAGNKVVDKAMDKSNYENIISSLPSSKMSAEEKIKKLFEKSSKTVN